MEVALNEAVMRRFSFSPRFTNARKQSTALGHATGTVIFFNNNKPTCVKSPLYSQCSPQAKAEGHKVIHFSEK